MHICEVGDRGRELDVGVAQLPRQRTIGHHLGGVVEGTGDLEAFDGVGRLHHFSDGGAGRGIVEPAFGDEHNGSSLSGRLAPEPLLHQVEATGGFTLEVAEAGGVSGSDRSGGGTEDDDHADPTH